MEGRLQLRSYEDREGQKHNVTEVVVITLRFLGPSKNGHGAKAAETSKASEPVDESENPFNGPGSEGTEEDIPSNGFPLRCLHSNDPPLSSPGFQLLASAQRL